MEDLSGSVKGLVMNNDLEKSAEERINIFFQFVKVCYRVLFNAAFVWLKLLPAAVPLASVIPYGLMSVYAQLNLWIHSRPLLICNVPLIYAMIIKPLVSYHLKFILRMFSCVKTWRSLGCVNYLSVKNCSYPVSNSSSYFRITDNLIWDLHSVSKTVQSFAFVFLSRFFSIKSAVYLGIAVLTGRVKRQTHGQMRSDALHSTSGSSNGL